MDAARLGFVPDSVIQELGWDDDVDEDLRVAIEKTTGNHIVDGDFGDVADGVILWWRDDEGDLIDALVDCLHDLDDGGSVWVCTPKVGREGHVEPADIAEAAEVAGLSTTTTTTASQDWSATKLSTRKR